MQTIIHDINLMQHRNKPVVTAAIRRNTEGLGQVSEIIGAGSSLLSSIAPLVANAFKKAKPTTWSMMQPYVKGQYVKQALQIATTAKITGKAYSTESVFREAIQQINENENWEKWKSNNPSFRIELWNAESQVKDYMSYGYRPDMEYINPSMINSVLNPKKSGVITNILPIVAVAGAAYIGMKIYNQHRIKQ